MSHLKSTLKVLLRCAWRFGVLLLIVPGYGWTEAVRYRGELFPVDSLTRVQADQYAVSLAGSSFMVSEQNLGRRLALAYAADARLAKALPWSIFLRFLEGLSPSEDSDILEVSAGLLLSSSQLSGEERAQLLRTLGRVDTRGEALLVALSAQRHASLAEPVCLVIRALDAAGRERAKVTVEDVVLRYKAVCSDLLRNSAHSRLARGEVDEALQDLEVSLAVFSIGPEVDRPIATALQRLSAIQQARVARDPFLYRAALQDAGHDPLLSEALQQGRSALVQQSAATFLDEGLSGGALSLLTLIEFERRSELTHALVSRALLALQPSERSVLTQDRVRSFLAEFARKDELVREQLTALLDSVVRDEIQKGELASAAAFFDAVRAVRPDPSLPNDTLRFAWADYLLKRGDIAQAEMILAQASNSAPLSVRLNIFRGKSCFIVPILVVALFGVVAAVLIRILRRRINRPRPIERGAAQRGFPGELLGADADSEYAGADGDDDDPSPEPRFVKYAKDLRGGSTRDEYEELLAVFGIRTGAKLNQIKNAYRNAVKSCHPDLNRNASAAEADRFIHLTRTYDRLLQLHAERTGER